MLTKSPIQTGLRTTKFLEIALMTIPVVPLSGQIAAAHSTANRLSFVATSFVRRCCAAHVAGRTSISCHEKSLCCACLMERQPPNLGGSVAGDASRDGCPRGAAETFSGPSWTAG
jgi:hypothetical protein